ncbi:MAG: glycosyltransferase family 39 protein [Candidatus Azambacteria bacterium]|nr:glycosyltransferase family 39 protein [Candidatus Azambacteria bacterium]
MPNKYITTALIVFIVVVAVFFRFWQFTSIPTGLYQDEAMNGADALTLIKDGGFSAIGGPASGWKAFYPNNNGREGLIVWLDALAINVFGAEPWVLRLFPALAGVLAVLGLYFLSKELFNIRVALVSSLFMATSFWAVNFSRTGFRAALMVPILIWSSYFLLKGFRLRKYIHFVLAGVLFGLGFYTYISFRFAPVLALLAFAPFLFNKNKKLWLGILAFIGVTFLVALPIGLYFLNNPADFFGRSSSVSIFSQDSPLIAVTISAIKTMGMFNIAGDFNWRHNYAGSPELFFPVGILFIIGIYFGVKRHSFEDRFILLWLVIFLLPNILTIEGNPHALRAVGAIPAAMTLSGIGLVWVYDKLKEYFSERQILPLLLLLLVFIAVRDFNLYFNKWAHNINVSRAFSSEQIEISKYLNSLSPQTEKYVLWHPNDRATDNGLPVSAQTVYFLTSQKTKITYLRADEVDKIKLEGNSAVIAPIYYDIELLHKLNKQFPQSKINFVDINTAVLIIP